MKRILTILTIASLILLCFSVIIWPASYHLDLCKGLGSGRPTPSDSVPLISGYRVGFEDGGIWLYNYEIPWMGGTWGLAKAQHYSWYHCGFGHFVDFDKEGKILTSERECNLPGIYFRRFWTPGRDPAYTTLSASLWYPILLSVILPLSWISRRFRVRENSSKPGGQATLAQP